MVHICFAFIFVGVIIFYYHYQNEHLIEILYKIASITYGPLLGLFAFGLFTKKQLKDTYVPFICVSAPVICFFLDIYADKWFHYSFDFELLLVNGLFTFLGLWLIRKKQTDN
ncbi:MAG: hypothetical protein WCY35_05235 [Bacteroidales bacterium]